MVSLPTSLLSARGPPFKRESMTHVPSTPSRAAQNPRYHVPRTALPDRWTTATRKRYAPGVPQADDDVVEIDTRLVIGFMAVIDCRGWSDM